MINIYVKDTDEFLGEITEEQLQFLVDQMEEEFITDQDYAITPMLVDEFEEDGADYDLIVLLRLALEAREEVEIRWERV